MINSYIIYYIISILCAILRTGEVNAIRVYAQMPFNINDGKVIYMKDSFDIYYSNKKTMYIFSNYILPDNPQTQIDTWKTYKSYFIFSKSDTIGQFYLDENSKHFTNAKVDSVLKSKGYKNLELFDSTIYDLFSKRIENETNLIQCIYTKKIGLNDKYPDTLECHFSKMENDIPFTFSPYLEKEYKLKNIYTSIKINSSNNLLGNIKMIPKQEFLFKLKIINPVPNRYMSIE